MLEAENIKFNVGKSELIADISLSLDEGLLHLIVGPNGAGKSTLIKLLARLLRPASGRVKYDGRDIAQATDADLAKCRAVLSQAIEIAFPLRVREVVMMGRYPHFGGRPGPADEKIVDETMALFDVTEFATRNYQSLSGGERQRVNFARVLAQLTTAPNASRTKRYLFLDEPLTFLDIRHQIGFMKMIRKLSADGDVITVGVVHDLNLAARFADQLVMIDHGKLIATGTAKEVLTSERIHEVFGVNCTRVPVAETGMHLLFD